MSKRRDYTTSITVRIPISLRREIESAAARRRTSMSEIVLDALRAYLHPVQEKEDRR